MHFEEVYKQHETSDRLSSITHRITAPGEWLQLRCVLYLIDEVGDYAARAHAHAESQAPSPVTEGGPASHLSPIAEGSESQTEDSLFKHDQPDLTKTRQLLEASIECHLHACDNTEEQ